MNVHIIPGITLTFCPVLRPDSVHTNNPTTSTTTTTKPITDHCTAVHQNNNDDSITEGGFGTVQVVEGPVMDASNDCTNNITNKVYAGIHKLFRSTLSPLYRTWPVLARTHPFYDRRHYPYRRRRVIKRYKRCKHCGILSFDFLREVNMYAILGRRHPNIAQVDIVDLWPDVSLSSVMSDITKYNNNKCTDSNNNNNNQSNVVPEKTWITPEDNCSWILRQWDSLYRRRHRAQQQDSEKDYNNFTTTTPTPNDHHSASRGDGLTPANMTVYNNELSGASILLRYYPTTLFDMVAQIHDQTWRPTSIHTSPAARDHTFSLLPTDIASHGTTTENSNNILHCNDDMLRRSPFCLLSLMDVCQFMNDIIRGLVEIYRHGFSYSDLKLENVLVSWDSVAGRYQCSLCDMGAVEFVQHPILVSDEGTGTYNDTSRVGKYQQVDFAVVSPGSCPPEVLCGLTYMDPIKCDMWMLGILMASMLLGTVNVLDRSACDTVTGELEQIFHLVGTPSRTEWPDLFRSPLWSACRLKRPELHRGDDYMEESSIMSPFCIISGKDDRSQSQDDSNDTAENNNNNNMHWRPMGQFRQCPVCAPCPSVPSRIVQLCRRRRSRGGIINVAKSGCNMIYYDRDDDHVQLNHALDLVCGLLRVNPDERYSIHRVMNHPFLSASNTSISSSSSSITAACNEISSPRYNVNSITTAHDRSHLFYCTLCETIVIVAMKENLSPYATIVSLGLVVQASQMISAVRRHHHSTDCYCEHAQEGRSSSALQCESCQSQTYMMNLILAVAALLIANQLVCFVESKPFITRIFRQLIAYMPRMDPNRDGIHSLSSNVLFQKYNNSTYDVGGGDDDDMMLEEVGVMQRFIVTSCSGRLVTPFVSSVFNVLRQKNIVLPSSPSSSPSLSLLSARVATADHISSQRLYSYLFVSILESIYHRKTVILDPDVVDICVNLAKEYGKSSHCLSSSTIQRRHTRLDHQHHALLNRCNVGAPYGHDYRLSGPLKGRNDTDGCGCCGKTGCDFTTPDDGDPMSVRRLAYHAIQCRFRWTNLKRHWGMNM